MQYTFQTNIEKKYDKFFHIFYRQGQENTFFKISINQQGSYCFNTGYICICAINTENEFPRRVVKSEKFLEMALRH